MTTTESPIADGLRDLIKRGLTFGEAVNVFAEFRNERDLKIVALAEPGSDGECEIDDNAQVSEGDDNGAYVMAWTWVSFVETELDKEPTDEEEDEDAEEESES